MVAHGGVRFEKRYIRPNGETVWADICGVTAEDAQGRPVYGIASGYMDADGASSAIARGAEFIAKPFTPSALIAKIRGVLDGAP